MLKEYLVGYVIAVLGTAAYWQWFDKEFYVEWCLRAVIELFIGSLFWPWAAMALFYCTMIDAFSLFTKFVYKIYARIYGHE